MKKTWNILTAALFWCACQSSPHSSEVRDTLPPSPPSPPPTLPSPDSYWTDLARVLAGLNPTDTIFWKDALQDTAWRSYAKKIESLWQTRKKYLYDSLSQWAARELEPYYTWKGRVFYPFSGADWSTIYYIYPKGEKYFFFGLEQEGDPHILRRLTPREITQSLQGPYGALSDLLRLSFFKTKEMQEQLARGKVRGLLPVFLALFARTGYAIYEVNHIYLKEGGIIDTLSGSKPKPPQSAWDNPITGLQFKIGLPGEPLQEVVYLSLNAANKGLEHQTGSFDLFNRLLPCVTFIKSASYLLFSPEFSKIRRVILTQSVAILQEDSGIPYRFFDSTAWKVQLYGVYTQPIPLFRAKYQKDLWQAYRRYPVKQLPFTIGYHIIPGTSNLLWATRRDPSAVLPPLPEEVRAAESPPSLFLPPFPISFDTMAPLLPDTTSQPSPPDTAAQDTVPSIAVPSDDSE
ncbi:MAG: hypothetical protein RMK19_05985 [Bacteroidia bacterium]|nr:hypothetical protein [Bacteroidia bacterium]MDW8015542.1 hypothetical protein [Bacteroidia bacterium]